MNAVEKTINASIFKLNINIYIAVPEGHEPPDLFEGCQVTLLKQVNLVPGQRRYHMDTALALTDIAEQGWHVWDLRGGPQRHS